MPKQNRDRPMTYTGLLEEVNQGHTTRRALYKKLENQLGSNKKVIAFFTSSVFHVLITNQDADMLEEVLRNSQMKNKELVLLLNSPGGDALAAERIVNICRSFSNGGFTVIVPKMAKSAATMVCLGAKEIGMGETSEMGPIDPQIAIYDERGNLKDFKAAHEVIESYNDLMKQANKSKGRLEPFLQQLARFDARDIRSIRSAQQLSESIAIRCLKNGMLQGSTDRQIKVKIKPFLDPRYTKVHGRPIYHDIAKACGLNVQLYGNYDASWQTVSQLYVKLNYFVSNNASKTIESVEDSYVAPPGPTFSDGASKSEV